jgi:hypothetical protein
MLLSGWRHERATESNVGGRATTALLKITTATRWSDYGIRARGDHTDSDRTTVSKVPINGNYFSDGINGEADGLFGAIFANGN